MKRSLKNIAELNVVRYPGWDPGTGKREAERLAKCKQREELS